MDNVELRGTDQINRWRELDSLTDKQLLAVYEKATARRVKLGTITPELGKANVNVFTSGAIGRQQRQYFVVMAEWCATRGEDRARGKI